MKVDKLQLQADEFTAAAEFSLAVRAHSMTPVIDDDYPKVRHRYEYALDDLIDAMKANGRFEGENRYGLKVVA